MLFFDNVFVIGIGLLFFVFAVGAAIRSGIVFTKKAWEVRKKILGFKKFLKMVEADRIDFLNSQGVSVDTIEYLPYAVALGIEKSWIKQFRKESNAEFIFFDPNIF
jgi:uncharacterized membrane protein